MKPTIHILLFLLMSTGLIAQKITPSEKVKAAYSSKELASMSQDQIQILNITAEKLCWFESPKNDLGEIFQMTLKNNTPVTLTPSDIAEFNPLLYNLPQENLACGNLNIIDSEGNKHLLIVRSSEMMKKEIERQKIAAKKTNGK